MGVCPTDHGLAAGSGGAAPQRGSPGTDRDYVAEHGLSGPEENLTVKLQILLLLLVTTVLCGTRPARAQTGNPAEELLGTYQGETWILPDLGAMPRLNAWDMTSSNQARSLKEYYETRHSLSRHTTDSFAIVNDERGLPGRKLVLTDYRGSTYYLIRPPYYSSDEAFFLITTDGDHEIGRLWLIHEDADDHAAHPDGYHWRRGVHSGYDHYDAAGKSMSVGYRSVDIELGHPLPRPGEEAYPRYGWENYPKFVGTYFKTGKPAAARVARPAQSSPGTPWTTVVGLGAAVVVALSVLARAAQKRGGGKTKKQDSDRVVGYVLQLSADQFALKPGVPAVLTVTVWSARADGRHTVASNAQIRLAPSSSPAGLRIEPSSGAGRLQSKLSWAGGSAPSACVTLVVTATAGGTNSSGSVQLNLETAQIIHEFADGKGAIRPDGKDSTVLRARVVLDGAGTVNHEATAALAFARGGQWLYTSEAVMWDTWKAVTVQALDPAGPDSNSQPPSPQFVTLTARCGETDLSSNVPVELLARPVLDVDLRPDTVTLIQGEVAAVKFHAIITNPGSAKWDWRISLDQEDLCTVNFKEAGPAGVIEVTVLPPTTSPQGTGGAQVSTKMHIFAEQSGLEPLERILPVRLTREGVVVQTRGRDCEGQYVLRCDMETCKEIDFVVYVKDPNGQLTADPALARKLVFEDDCRERQQRNLLSVAQPEIKPGRPTAERGCAWTVRSQQYVPGETGEVYRIPMIVRVIGKEERPEFSADFCLGLKVVEPDIGSDDWRRERDGCRRAIRLVPEPFRAKLAEAIDRWAQTLGHEGLKAFRKKIWRIAQDLILADGAEGYRDQARWEDRCLFLAENVKWGSDLVFTAGTNVAFPGAVGMIGVPVLKSLIERILVVASERYFDDSERGVADVDDWFWECVTELEQTLDWATVMQQGALVVGGLVTDPAVLEKVLGDSPRQKAAAWGIYVGYQFASNMARGMSMCDALKQTLRTVRDRLVVQFLMGRMKWSFQTPQAIKDAAARMTGNPPRMTEADMIAIQSDPQLLRSLKVAPANVQQGFLQTYRNTLITPHDAQLVAHVRTIPGYEGVVRVETFSTPGKSGSGVGADRDFRVTMQNPDGTWREVPAATWRDESNRILGTLSGGRSLQQLNWRATDRFDIEASPDYATQNGQISNFTQVVRGRSVLRDPKQFANMWQQKMTGVEPVQSKSGSPPTWHAAPPLENVAQAQKACSTLNAVRRGYQQQGYNVNHLTPQMQKGMQIVQRADVTAMGDYNSVNQALQNAGFKGGFNDFANKVAGQFQALGMARRG
ncbi:MAG: hypothetical protein HY319_15090 [Armatimonadetes bacterium]|nr:hypothetical protein [Armatimonadota bacterium]